MRRPISGSSGLGTQGVTLIEVLIALVLAMLTLLPALAAFSATMRAAGRHADACRLHVAATTALEKQVARLRRDREDAERRIRTDDAWRVVVQVGESGRPPRQTVAVTAEGRNGTVQRQSRTLFPPSRETDREGAAGGRP